MAAALITAFDEVWPAKPAGAAFDWGEERTRTGCAVWARRGQVFAVHAPGNTPRIHGLWLTANTMAPCVVIGERAAELLTSEHRQ